MQIDDVRGGAGDPGRQSGHDFRYVDWVPDESRSECCGPMCETCGSGNSGEWFCEGSPVRLLPALAGG